MAENESVGKIQKQFQVVTCALFRCCATQLQKYKAVAPDRLRFKLEESTSQRNRGLLSLILVTFPVPHRFFQHPFDFLNSDIINDILCAKRVVRDSQGMGAWYGWKDNCRNRDLSHFLD
ncbi:hypothetical protein scyTo_0021938 [Scyliorhinus torazame]|uniref:Lysozyme n=1 Tax=Scyliorhinus torazame TaxID=75743 RepID=A0A401Q9N3_SCYTO|nr:hypothetical protein [Scyliorhinus torazame]